MPRYHFEDFVPGTQRVFGAWTLSKDEIVTFARQFDNQPMHADEEAAKKGFFGSLVASGWNLCAVFMRMTCDGYLLDSASMGAPGIDEVRWQKPAFPGDVLSIRLSVLDARISGRRPEMGLVELEGEMLNQKGEAIMTVRYWAMMGRRDPRAPAPNGHKTTPPHEASTNAAETLPSGNSKLLAPYLEDAPLNKPLELGAVTFTAEDIKRFARKYDPQPFHVDEAAARVSHFGGLCASGWHTASAFMGRMLETQTARWHEAAERGEPMARIGPSPGFINLRWSKPVYAGDTITFRTTMVEKRVMRSRPHWGIAFSLGTGHNQHGEPVYEFRGGVMWERRP
jgi:acyl dehydratase